MTKSFSERAGEILREQVDAPASPGAHAIARARLVNSARSPKPRRVAPLVLGFAAAATVIAAVLLLVLPGSTEQAITLQPVGPVSQQDTGTYFAPGGEEPLVLRFSEGSQVTLEPSSRARIAKTTPHGASLVLEAGRARLDVVQRSGTAWTVVAGPYRVEVRGTAFLVSWDALTATFDLQMQHGAVMVYGPGIEAGVRVEGTQHFVTNLPEASASSREAAALPDERDQPPAGAGGQPAAEAAPAQPDEPATAPPRVAPSGSAPKPHEAQPWSTLASHGDYDEILQQAERRGMDTSLYSANADELWALTTAARVRGRGGLAHKALMAVRSRFPGSPRAGSAAFLLGRMSDDGGNPSAALVWYDRYLAEAPGGVFAPEALGRRMVALQRSGSSDAARGAAREYLARFPKGPYAGVAREMAER